MRYEQTAAAAATATTTSYHSSGTATEARVSPAPSPATGRHQDIDEELRDAFQVFDKDKDGFLNATDLRSVPCTSLQVTLNNASDYRTNGLYRTTNPNRA